MMAQAKLKSLGYESPKETLGVRFHINPTLLARLSPGKGLSKAGEEIMVPNVTHAYALPADKMVVSKNNRMVLAFSADGKLLAPYPATRDSKHEANDIMEPRGTPVHAIVDGTIAKLFLCSPQAPHLHFTIFQLGPEKRWWKGTPINPYPVLQAPA